VTKQLLDGAGLKLGLFSANCSSGMAVTTIEDRWAATWEDNLQLAKLADESGIDFMLPIARWIGYGGATNFHESVLDPVALAAALLAHTERLFVFGTIHTAFNHPVVAAKAMATVDQVGRGRAGLNIVAGWNKPEYDAMGIDLPQDHDDRYAMAQEWWEIVRRLWSEPGRYDIDGRFWRLQGVESNPKPYDGLPPILNAGSSPQGRDFAARNSDVVFTVVGGPEDGAEVVKTVTAAARDTYGRRVGVFTPSYCVCRQTRAEAQEFHRWYAEEHADWDAVDNLMTLQGLHAQSFTPEMLEMFRGRFAAGHGVCPLIGTPDDVAAEIQRFAQAGFGGMTLSFVDYISELEFFAAEVLPRLERLGVRQPRSVRQA
jgi:alkanesulfonate monooxygenase SsuD/methylene tetrahydromethanopterin reductase-like flavin-dependent oxidoreductase (luciferase family)